MTVATVSCTENDKPRVISEVRKSKRRPNAFYPHHHEQRTKISGELLWSATPTQWHVKLAEVRQGSLLVHNCSSGDVEFRLPLHHLNITAAHTPRTFTLATTLGIPLATFQTLTEEEYQRWVRVLAVEVLRQTPLQDVRFLDIIGITRGSGGLLRKGQSEECLTRDYLYNGRSCESPQHKKKRDFSQWLQCVKLETEEENRAKNTDFDMKNMKIRRAQKTRPKLPFAEAWAKLRGETANERFSRQVAEREDVPRPTATPRRSISMDNLSKCCTQRRMEVKQVSDESGISSGDENHNVISDSDKSKAEDIYVSVREKKNFFESLGDVKRQENRLNRSNSVSHFDIQPKPTLCGQRATSMQDLRGTNSPVKQMKRLFENGSTSDLAKSTDDLKGSRCTIVEENESEEFVNPTIRKPRQTVNYANIQFCRSQKSVPENVIKEEEDLPEKKTSIGLEVSEFSNSGTQAVLIQRKLQRGERKLTKLRIQIAEVEETIRHIAEDLQSIGPNTLKKRSGLEVFAALRRRLEEETSRLERLQEETAKVISDNQRTILKLPTLQSAPPELQR